MNNISLNGQTVKFLAPSKRLLVFDTLYTDEMRSKNYLFEDNKYSIFEIESNIFEWSDGTLLGLYALTNQCSNENEVEIEVSLIKHFSEENHLQKEKAFGTDSALICIIDFSKVSVFLDLFNYDDFVENLYDAQFKTKEYLQNIEQMTGPSFAIISTPGIGKGYEFIGSGRYIIEGKCFE